MNAVPLPILFDNPIVVKHLRSRLRPGSMVVWLGGVVLVCVAILGIHYFLRGGLGLGHELEWLLALQAYLIGILAAYQAGSALGGARESGTFEYYRLSPLPPSCSAWPSRAPVWASALVPTRKVAVRWRAAASASWLLPSSSSSWS